MATKSLFLNIYSFNLQKIKESYSVTTPSGVVFMRHTTEKDFIMLDKFFDTLPGESYEDKFKTLFSEFVSKFDSHYIVKREKGISMHPNHRIVVHSKKFFAWGEFSGGHTGREQQVYKRDDSTLSDYTISKEKMVASPFFFLIWIPKDSNMGLLFLHR